MSKFFISCKESRIESNRSFYSSFFLGPFDPSESLTVANALRRTLLSELPGIAIVSVEIEGAPHEYSNIPGVRDSVLDILLNIKEVVLKKLSKNMRPQVGYLRVRGPGIVRAGDFRLPPLIQCIDPEQYIATLSEDGVLNMKFIIDEGKNYIKVNPKTVVDLNQFKKRRLILKKLNQLCNNSSILNNYYINLNKKTLDNKHLVRSKAFFKQEEAFSLKKKDSLIPNKQDHFKKSSSLNLLNVDAVFNPINKVNYIIEVNDHKVVENVFEKSNFIEDPLKILNTSFHPAFKDANAYLYQDSSTKKVKLKKAEPLLSKPAMRCLENLLNYQINLARLKKLSYKKNERELPTKKQSSFELVNNKLNQAWLGNKFLNMDEIIDEIIKLKNQTTLDQINPNMDLTRADICLASGKKESLQHNIIIEIWTNGSLHPREAMYSAFKHLIKLFSKLRQIKILNQIFKSDRNYNNLIRRVKNENFDLFPLNENIFLGNYAGIKRRGLKIPLEKDQRKNDLKLNTDQNRFNNKSKKLINSSEIKSKKKLLDLDPLSLIDIGTLNMPLRPYACLKRSNINTISVLLQKSKKDLLKLPNLGKKSLEEIEKSLSKVGLSLLR